MSRSEEEVEAVMENSNIEVPLLLHPDPEAAVTFCSRSDSIFINNRKPNSMVRVKSLFILLGPLLCALICLFAPVRADDGKSSSRNMLGVLAWIFTWWLTDAVPMPITSMAPLFLFPFFGIANADQVAHSYMDDVISLVLGSFILALAVEHYNIHRRLALNVTLLFCGEPLNPKLLLLGICGTTAFVSMWMHNVAAAVMMMPVATGILQRIPAGACEEDAAARKFCKAVVLGVIYSAAVGGMSTLTGTGVNLILVGMWRSYFPEEESISFSTWFMFGFPLALFIFLALWAILCFFYCSDSSSSSSSSSPSQLSDYLDKSHLKSELQMLGPISFAEKVILATFSILIVLWMTRSITDDIPGWGALFNGRAGDGTASVMMATVLFVIPNKKQEGQKIMDWNKCKKLPWNVVLLLGAGFAIADGFKSSGLANELSTSLGFLERVPYWGIAPIVCLISGFMTEFTSNNSTTTLVVPVLIQIADTMKVHPLLLMIPGAIGAQFAFLLPTGTASNIVGFSTGHIHLTDMLTTGLPLKLAGTAALSLLMPTLGVIVFGTNNWPTK